MLGIGDPSMLHHDTSFSDFILNDKMDLSVVFRTEKSWKNTIAKLMKKSQFILVKVDSTDGVMYEINYALTHYANKVIFLIEEKEDFALISVVLNCGPMFERSKELLNFAFNNYEQRILVKSDNVIGYTKNKNLEEDIPLYIKEDLILPLTKEEFENINIVYDYPKNLSKPAKKDDEIGFIKIYSQNNLIFKQKIYIMVDEI